MDKFHDTRPYDDCEIEAAMARIVADPLLEAIRGYLFPDLTIERLNELFLSSKTTDQFQTHVMHQAIRRILKASQSSLEVRGLEKLDREKAYLFVSNHRDIVLDSAFLQVGLKENGFRTTEITFGSNLMHPGVVVDIGKSNKMFKVVRASNTREFLLQSRNLSEYIRYAIEEKRESVWIAQRNGRTKDGNDVTEQGLIKMFSISGDSQKNIARRLSELNIMPMVISYQYEPCDALKVQELYISSRRKYEKAPNEDINSILTGIQQKKGKVIIQLCKPLNDMLPKVGSTSNNHIFREIAELIDQEIHSNYCLFNTNYIAWDILHDSEKFLDIEYTKDARNEFSERMYSLVDGLHGDRSELIARFLNMYSYPLRNKLGMHME